MPNFKNHYHETFLMILVSILYFSIFYSIFIKESAHSIISSLTLNVKSLKLQRFFDYWKRNEDEDKDASIVPHFLIISKNHSFMCPQLGVTQMALARGFLNVRTDNCHKSQK